MKHRTRALLLCIPLVLPVSASAQYWGERVLEKSFERTDFFFTPNTLSPFGIGNFKTSAVGLVDDPLINLTINPSRLRLDSGSVGYFYTDFRSARELRDKTDYYGPWIDPAVRTASSFAPFPTYYVSTRRELEPVFSGAAIGTLPTAEDHFLTFGATYQLMLQDDKYYNIPQDIYRTSLGYDYNGMRAAGAEKMPIVDRYDGEDNIHQVGHFVNLFASTSLPGGFDVGVRLGRVSFGREGGVGSSNYWQYANTSQSASYWSNIEQRDQQYAHWDAGAGIRYHLSDRTSLGVAAGMVWGDASQAMRTRDSSYYAYSSTPSVSYYDRSGNNLQLWHHSGQTPYFGLDLTACISPAVTLTLLYQYQRAAIDLDLQSSILDTSYSTYSWDNNGTPVNSTSLSFLSDTRTGGGKQVETVNRAKASVQWTISPRVRLSLGAQMEWVGAETRTNEAVRLASRYSYSSSSGSWNSSYGENTSKDLLWAFTSDRWSFQIPLFVTIRASDVSEIILGLNRNMSRWKMDDVTLALFRYRENLENGSITRLTNFGERYTQPTEQVSDVRTTFLAGLSISPSNLFHLRLLMVPNFRDGYGGTELEQLQWWIGVTLTP